MTSTFTDPQRAAAKAIVVEALARLRALFPLESRIAAIDAPLRSIYGQILNRWRQAEPPQTAEFDADKLAALERLDSLELQEAGIGCYPFSARPTGIEVRLPAGRVQAMCALDALAVARLAGALTEIHARCAVCATPLNCQVQANGGLDHDQVDKARIIWQEAPVTEEHRSQGLCRKIRFICPACPAPTASLCLTLPQAATVANAFFRFQLPLLASGSGDMK